MSWRTPFDIDEIRAALSRADGVNEIDDLHVWQICSEITIATAHVETSAETIRETEEVYRQIHDTLAECDVDHATVELRPAHSNHPRLDTHAHY